MPFLFCTIRRSWSPFSGTILTNQKSSGQFYKNMLPQFRHHSLVRTVCNVTILKENRHRRLRRCRNRHPQWHGLCLPKKDGIVGRCILNWSSYGIRRKRTTDSSLYQCASQHLVEHTVNLGVIDLSPSQFRWKMFTTKNKSYLDSFESRYQSVDGYIAHSSSRRARVLEPPSQYTILRPTVRDWIKKRWALTSYMNGCSH